MDLCRAFAAALRFQGVFMAAQSLPVVCYDLPTISRFFRSCAVVMAMQQTTHIEWTTYRDSKVLNAIYATLFWKEPPGFAQARMGTQADIDRRTNEMHERFLMTWVKKLTTDGPAAATRYVSDMAGLKDYARKALDELYREIGAINEAVIGETQRGINNLAAIKLGAQVGVAVIGAAAGLAFVGAAAAGTATAGGVGLTILGLDAGAGGLAFAGVGAANSISHSVVKTWEGGTGAKVAGVAWEVGKAGTGEVGSTIAGNVLDKSLQGGAKSAQIILSARGEIEKQAARLAQAGLKKKAQQKAVNIITQRAAQIQVQKTAQAGFQSAAINAARMGRIIPVAFAAWDIWDAVSDYRETVGN